VCHVGTTAGSTCTCFEVHGLTMQTDKMRYAVISALNHCSTPWFEQASWTCLGVLLLQMTLTASHIQDRHSHSSGFWNGAVFETVAASLIFAYTARNVILYVAITPVRVIGRVSCAIRPSLQHHVPYIIDSAHAALQLRQKRPYMSPSYRGISPFSTIRGNKEAHTITLSPNSKQSRTCHFPSHEQWREH
jgi:hypothetical protein